MDFVEGDSDLAVSSLIAAAHELKAPLVLLRQLSFQIDDEAVAERVKLTSERALRLADGLTKAARLEDGLFELAPINVGRSLAESIQEIAPLADAKQIAINLPKPRRKLPMAVANRDLLRAILANLLDNALQYTQARVDVAAQCKQKELEITVRDYGATIELGEFKKLETNLGHMAQTMSARPLSSGLGLLIASRMSQAMHGDLRVARHRQGGLSFTLSLPAVRQLSFLET
jgi:two-component system phosphate regulon sensor histidine kinase PhoR